MTASDSKNTERLPEVYHSGYGKARFGRADRKVRKSEETGGNDYERKSNRN